jgi:hypothetical protein
MPIDFAKIKEVASSSLMPDFFAVRIDEEGQFDGLKQLLAKIKLAVPNPKFDRIKQIGAAAATANDFIESIKKENLFATLREILTKIQVAQ